jgi:hypothetical protein
MAGNAGAAPDQLHFRALVDVHIPTDLTQECGGEQTGHRAANDDGAPIALQKSAFISADHHEGVAITSGVNPFSMLRARN